MTDESPPHLHHLSESSSVPRLTRRAYVACLREGLELPKKAVWAATLVAGCLVLTLASARLAISSSSFGRPHTMLLAWIEGGTVFALRAARRDDARLWVAGGAVLGSSVFVHPTAPLYAATAFGTALLYARRPLRAWPGLVALAVTLVPYYVATAHTLSSRYGVGGGVSGRT